jgi:hypothetical protein
MNSMWVVYRVCVYVIQIIVILITHGYYYKIIRHAFLNIIYTNTKIQYLGLYFFHKNKSNNNNRQKIMQKKEILRQSHNHSFHRTSITQMTKSM